MEFAYYMQYSVHYTSTHFCGMLIGANRGYIGAMLPNYQDVLCLLAPQCSHNSQDSQQLQNDEPMHKSASLHKKSVAVELACRVRSCCRQHFHLLQLFPPPCRLWRSATKEFGKKNLTMLAVPQTSLHAGRLRNEQCARLILPLDQDFLSKPFVIVVWVMSLFSFTMKSA